MARNTVILGIVLAITMVSGVYAASEGGPVETTIRGTVEEVNYDDLYIVVDGQRIAASGEIMEEAYFEPGDRVEILAVDGESGLEIAGYTYSNEYDEDAGGDVYMPGEDVPSYDDEVDDSD